jgi:hypothetical protein
MRNREAVLIVVVILAVLVVLVLAFRKTSPPPSVSAAPLPAPSSHPTPPTAIAPPPVVTPLPEYPQLSLKKMSKDEATRIYIERLRKDPESEGKVDLNFYGKVVDENNQPVAGATAHMQWNTVGVPGGTAYGQAVSDGGGLFSLTQKHGKVLEVSVDKPGYYTVDGGAGGLAFEYADPSSPEYNEPDPNNPVIFHLRRKGEGAKLFSKSLDVPLSQNHPQDRVNLMQGFIKPDGVLTIASDTSKFLPGAQPFPWTVTLSMAEGGLIETSDQFPFMAPASGYTPTVTMDMTNLDRSIWRGSLTKTYYFYLPSTNTYGRMTVNASSSLPLGLNYTYNPTPGSRVLEPATQ